MTYADMVGRDNILGMETDSLMCKINDTTLIQQGHGTYKIGKELVNMEIELDTITQPGDILCEEMLCLEIRR